MTITESNTKPLRPNTKIEQGPGKVLIPLYVHFANSNTPERHPASGSMSFYSRPDPEALAREQGVSPVTSFEQLLGDFWPEDESLEDFLEARRRWRREGRDANT